jgi:hypothetical protein
VDIIAGANTLLEGVDEKGDPTPTKGITHIEVDVQWAKTYKDRSGIAFQVKVPINLFFTSIDAYYQIPGTHPRWYYGVGAELGLASSLYGVLTFFPAEQAYLTLTPRVLTGGSRGDIQLNPQVAFGWAGPVDISAFVSYAYHTGKGINVELDLTHDGLRDYRKRYMLTGLSVRF